MAFRIAITYTQETGDKTDHRTLIEDFSDDPSVHNTKTKIFTQEISAAAVRISDRLTDLAAEAVGGKPNKPQ